MKNIYITQGIYFDKNNSIYFKTELNWVEYAKKHKFNLIQINSINNLYNKKIDGIIFSGGNDLSKIKKNKLNLLRDKLEKKIFKYAKKNKIPCLFVCRGMQFLANEEKIKIIKDNSKKHVGVHHKIKNNQNEIIVNSYHNYIIKKINKNFTNIAYSKKDNSIEMTMHNKYNFLSMMFHPERFSPDQKKIDKIFKKFFKL